MNDTNIYSIWNCSCGGSCTRLFPCETCKKWEFCDGVCSSCIEKKIPCKGVKAQAVRYRLFNLRRKLKD